MPLRKCHAQTWDVEGDPVCIQVACVATTTGPNGAGKVTVKWKDKDNNDHSQDDIKPGTLTECFGPVTQFTLHAEDCNAMITFDVCKCGDGDEDE